MKFGDIARLSLRELASGVSFKVRFNVSYSLSMVSNAVVSVRNSIFWS